MLCVFRVLHGASASAWVSQSRAGSVSDRPLTAAPAQEPRPLPQPQATREMSENVSYPQHVKASAHATGSFQIWSWKQFKCSSFSATMTQASLFHRAGVLLPFVLALSRIWHWDWILHPSFCTPGLVNSGLINSLVSITAGNSPLGHCNRAQQYCTCSQLPFISSIPTLSQSYLSGRTKYRINSVRENSTAGPV